MKNVIVRVLVAGCALTGAAVYAQNTVLTAEIPFAFYMGDKTMPAGKYNVDDMSYGRVLTLRSATAANRLSSWIVSSNHNEEAPRLVFQCYDGACFLKRVWTGNSAVGIAVAPSKHERELARASAAATLAEVKLAVH